MGTLSFFNVYSTHTIRDQCGSIHIIVQFKQQQCWATCHEKPQLLAWLLGRNFTGLVESEAWKYTVGLQAAYQRECALRSQSWTEYFMSLANVVCMIWTINQMLTACLGKRSVKWRRACTAQSKWHLGEKKRGKKKNKEKNVYGTGMILLAFTLNVWKLILIWGEADVSGETQISIPRCPLKFDLCQAFDNHSVEKPFRTFLYTF